MACKIPIMSPIWPPVKRDTPITPRENLLRAFNHEKPLWMPNLNADTQIISCPSNHDTAPSKGAAGVDWFGTRYVYSDAVGINMPSGGVFDEVTEWRDKVKWPDLDAIDWAKDAEGFQRDETRALAMRFSNGLFERLHAFEGFEQCLVDLFVEPEECRALFERLADYKIDLFNHIRDVFPLDYIIAADDYGTAKAPFFSMELFEETLLEPTKRFIRAVQARGTKFFAHCCGKVEPFVPYFAGALGVDGIELQPFNDYDAIIHDYGDRLMVEVRAENEIIHDDEVSDEQILSHARALVDRFGAHRCSGSGGVIGLQSSFEHTYRLMDEEIYRYSLEKYSGIL